MLLKTSTAHLHTIPQEFGIYVNVLIQTFIVNIKTTEDKLDTLQCLTQSLVVVTNILLRSFTKWQ